MATTRKRNSNDISTKNKWNTSAISVIELLHKPTHLKWNQVLATAFAFYHVVPHYEWSLTKTINFKTFQNFMTPVFEGEKMVSLGF